MLPHLGLGGAQRVASCMATHWTECGHKVTVVTLMDTPPDFHRLNPRVERVRLPRPNGRLVRARRSLAARIERSDLSADRSSTPLPGRPHRAERPLGGVCQHLTPIPVAVSTGDSTVCGRPIARS